METKLKILLADASEAFAAQLTAALEQNPMFCVAGAARDAVRAGELLEREQPDVLIVDLLLPKGGGIAVLKQASVLPRPPLALALTGALPDMDARTLTGLGVRYMIRKPCKMQAVASCVREIVAAERKAVHSEPDDEELAQAVMRELGVPCCLNGAAYLREAVLLALDTPGIDEQAIYAHLAEKYLIAPSRVCRAIGHAFSIAWGRSNLDVLQKYFGSAVFRIERTPSNADCIARLKNYLQTRGQLRRPAMCSSV